MLPSVPRREARLSPDFLAAGPAALQGNLGIWNKFSPYRIQDAEPETPNPKLQPPPLRCFSLGSRFPSWPTNYVVLYVHESGCSTELWDRLIGHDDLTGRVCSRQSAARSKKADAGRGAKRKGESCFRTGKER